MFTGRSAGTIAVPIAFVSAHPPVAVVGLTTKTVTRAITVVAALPADRGTTSAD